MKTVISRAAAFIFVMCVSFTAQAGSIVTQSCSWDQPGANRFTGNPTTAVDNYKDISPATRVKLKRRLASPTDYDDVVIITRDSIRGKSGAYTANITDMHFGANRMCKEVTRSKWNPAQQERGLVFCEDGVCLVLPTVCGNLARIEQRSRPATTQVIIAPPEYVATAPILSLPPAVADPVVPADSFASESQPSMRITSVRGGEGNPNSLINTPSGATPGTVYFPPASLPPPIPAIPEPSTWMLFVIGVIVILFIARRKF